MKKYFNTTLVQLKEISGIVLHRGSANFNTTLVQLKACAA